jgi:hypothetical protein
VISKPRSPSSSASGTPSRSSMLRWTTPVRDLRGGVSLPLPPTGRRLVNREWSGHEPAEPAQHWAYDRTVLPAAPHQHGPAGRTRP